MYPCVSIKFRMKCECQLILISYTDDTILYNTEDLRLIPGCIAMQGINIRRTDEGHRNFSDSGNIFLRMEASELPAVSITSDSHRDSCKICIVLSVILKLLLFTNYLAESIMIK